MANTKHLGFTLLESGQANPEIAVNQALQLLDVIAGGGRCVQRGLSAPPAGAEGDMYIVEATGTGSWASHDDKIAHYVNAGWTFYTPYNGMRVHVNDDTYVVHFIGEHGSGGKWKARTGDCVLSMIDVGGNTNMDAGADLPWDTEILKRGDGEVFTHGANSTDIVLKEVGHYEIHANISARTVDIGFAAGLCAFWLILNGVEVDGSKAYSRFYAGLVSGPSTTINMVINNTTVDHVLKLHGDRIAGSDACTVTPNTQRITIRKI